MKVSRVLARQTPAAEEQASLLDELANASVQGLVATGACRGCRVLRLGTGGDAAEASITGRRCADVAGFDVHANVRVRANDRDGLERLVKYLARPPIANDRLSELPDGRLALAFKQPWRDGTTHVVLSPHELIEKLIPLIPRPRAHLGVVDVIEVIGHDRMRCGNAKTALEIPTRTTGRARVIR